MHEASICRSIARRVVKEGAAQEARGIVSVELALGELTLLNPEQMRFWLTQCFRGTVAQDCTLTFGTVPAKIVCQVCSYEGRLQSDTMKDPLHRVGIACPQCGSTRVEVTAGRECVLRRITVVRTPVQKNPPRPRVGDPRG